MRGLMIVLVIVALAAAGGVSFFANKLISEVREKPATPLEATVATPPMVAVAASDIEPGATLTDKAVRWQPWPGDALRAEYVVVPPNASVPDKIKADGAARFAGKVARRPIAAGQPLTDALVFARGNAGFLAGNLSPGHRAVALPVGAESAAAGFILPGDKVDVILSQDVRRHVGDQADGSGRDVAVVRFSAETVVENVRVLAVDQTMAAGEDAAEVVETATLEVTPEQAEALAVARHMGSISLTLRSLEERPMMVAEGEETSEGAIVQASGTALALGRQAAGTWISDVEVSPSLAAVAGFDRRGNPLAPPQADAPAPQTGTAEPPKPEPWRVTVHRAREPAEVVRGRDEDEEDAASANEEGDGLDSVHRGRPGASVDTDRMSRGLSTMSRGAMPSSVTRIIGGG